MTATLKRGTEPPRSPERQRLALAQQAHAAAMERQARVAEAQQRHDATYFGQIRPAVARAKEALDAPRALLDNLLGDDQPAVRSNVADAANELAEAEAGVENARQARDMLADEASRAANSAAGAERDLTAAVNAVVATDPGKQAVVDELRRARRRFLQMQRILMTLGHGVDRFAAEDIGLGLRIYALSEPGNMGSSLFTPDGAWRMALAALREDAESQLPGLPEPQPEPDTGSAQAA
jgi:hypothetical protein